MTTKPYTLCTVAPGASYDALDVTTYTAPEDAGLPDDYTAFFAVPGGVAGYAAADGRADVYTAPAPGEPFAAPKTAAMTAGHDIVVAATIGTDAYAVGYDATTGAATFYTTGSGEPVASNTLTLPAGGTTLVPFQTWLDGHWLGGSYLICYDTATGAVGTFQLAVAGGSVTATQVWQPAKPWAEGWTRVSPFQLGTANYFLKTNVKYGDVFVDHLMDDASEGSHPAAKDLPLPVDLTATTTFRLGHDPFFATYLADGGAVTFHRFCGDVQGWTPGATATAVAGGTQAVTVAGSTVLFY